MELSIYLPNTISYTVNTDQHGLFRNNNTTVSLKTRATTELSPVSLTLTSADIPLATRTRVIVWRDLFYHIS